MVEIHIYIYIYIYNIYIYIYNASIVRVKILTTGEMTREGHGMTSETACLILQSDVSVA